MTKKELEKIVKNYKINIGQVNELIEEIIITENITEEYKVKLKEMGIIYQLSFLEAFNHDFFVELFSDQPYIIIAKEIKNIKDQEKLKLSFKQIIELNAHELLLEKMAEKMYSEVFDFYKLGVTYFVRKLLDSFLELEFSRYARERGLSTDELQAFKNYRNKLVHRSIKERKPNNSIYLDNLKLKNLIIDYIDLIEELVSLKYYDEDRRREIINL